jgi:hypothetical protein
MQHLRMARVCLPAHAAWRGGVARRRAALAGCAQQPLFFRGTSAGGANTDCAVVTEQGRRAWAAARPLERDPAAVAAASRCASWR